MTDSTKIFQFSPVPAPHPMKWGNLLPPVQRAVRDLLVRLQGAETTRIGLDNPGRDKLELGNCFLVYGSRGTGKTTVLLSSQEAVCPDSSFFEETNYQKARREKLNKILFEDTNYQKAKREKLNKTLQQQEDKRKHAAEECGKALQNNLVWLDILDLESLPTEANLLTTLLTRVSNALDHSDCNNTAALTSIFEEGADSARPQLGQLINAATLMWENIHEQDTRSIANRQIAAADIYAKFRSDFKKAMDKLSQELGRSRGLHDKGCSILLPIDNIDRSTDHLQSIVKLAQMVSHRRLWLVMAGDRVEVETFLERAYWKELIHSPDGADARGKMGGGGEDETLVMARRQAAATARKLWPPSHRIEVSFVEPEETLNYRPPEKNEEKTIYELLWDVKIPTSAYESKDGEDDKKEGEHDKKDDICLIKLFDIKPRRGKKRPGLLTRTGQHGFRLGARGVIDIWQLAYCVVNDSTDYTTDESGAEKIARTILRHAIAASKMPSTMSQCLQYDIIQQDPNGKTLLNFKTVNLTIECLASVDSEFLLATRPQKIEGDLTIRSRIGVRNSEDMFLKFKLKDEKGSEVELPAPVAAWLSILYDILIFVDRLAVIGAAKIQTPIIGATHEVVDIRKNRRIRTETQELRWPAPDFATFLAQDMFWQKWKQFQETREKVECNECGNKCYPRIIALDWVECVLETFVAINILDAEDEEKFKVVNTQLLGSITLMIEKIPEIETKDYIQCVLENAAKLYKKIKPEITSKRNYFDGRAVIGWLEQELPFLLTRLYVPIDINSTESNSCSDFNILRTHLQNILESKDKSNAEEQNLVEYWIENRSFIFANLDEKLAEIFPDHGKLAIASREMLQTQAYGDLREALENIKEVNPPTLES